VSTRPVVAAERRDIVGKKVSTLRRLGILPGVVYGHGQASQPIQLDAREFRGLLRTMSRNAILDLKVGGGRAMPVLVHGVHEHPVKRVPVHVDFYVVRMTEELALDVPVHHVGTSLAAEKLGGTLLHLRESVQIRALPADLPSALELDISSLADFDAVLHVRDIVAPAGVTIVTDPEEPLARVQPPRVEEEVRAAAAEVEERPERAEAAEAAQAAAEPGTSPTSSVGSPEA